ncbi:MAG: integrase arm-type DNA-binding domain-containing protein [Erythrobacter sp.]
MKCRKATKGRHHDGQGLYLLVKESGARSWVLRVQQDGKRHEIGLGGFAQDNPIAEIPILRRRLLSLGEAREKAGILRRYAKAGGNPIAERDKDRIEHRTFAMVAKACHAEKGEGWAPKTSKAFLATLERHAFPAIETAYIEHVEATDFQRVLKPIWRDRPSVADKVAKHIKTTLRFARAKGWRKAELPDWQLVVDGLPNRDTTERHYASVPWKEMPALVGGFEPDTTGKAALLFTILTAARSGEVRSANWSHIDLAEGLWNRPPDVMKNGRAHTVTLSAQAVALLEALPKGGDFVFTAPRGGKVSDMTISKALKGLGRAETVHGLRSSFREWAAVKFPDQRDAAEMALAHIVGSKVERAYQRNDLQDLRGPLLQAWGDYCFSVAADNAVQTGGAA